ncbi:hypothetical protein [Limnohabitans sp.]|uniref:hypothetical protein n=1 Tax=Limnohabitans sp. TaxID=1907725 RepID=UPI00286F50F0|nr:hypothetical protein [Limnohabitans sp.]
MAAALPGTQGRWMQVEAGIWHFVDDQMQVRGFVLSGAQTVRRAEQVKCVAA